MDVQLWRWGGEIRKEGKKVGRDTGREDSWLWVYSLLAKDWKISEWPQTGDHSQLELFMWPN